MKKIFFFVAFILTMPLISKAQLEGGIQLGAANYLGDLAPESVGSSLGETNLAAGVFARYNFGKWVSAKASFNYARLSADDKSAQRTRNLHFRSNIYELGLTAEFNIFGYQPYNLRRVFSPYIFVGVAGFKFNPKAEYNGKWVALQPLGTEGQGMTGRPAKYNLFQVSIPVGLGAKYAINDLWNIGLEFGIRKTFTDYLDDVSSTYVDFVELANTNGELAAELSWRGDELTPPSTPPAAGVIRGNANNKDWYIISVFTVSYNFTDNGLVGSRGRNRRGHGCPTF